jgi:NAD(P)-dependent dehydrogenase (short-subunit alcohol dehydrogenase family)
MKQILESFRSDLFANQFVVVSGGSSGLGLAIAQGFAGLGANVVATGTSDEKLLRADADPANRGIEFRKLDVRNSEAVAAFFKLLPSLNALVNAQGIGRPVDEWNEAAFLDVIDVNLSSVMRTSMAAKPHLERSRGSILNIASMLSYLMDVVVPAYTTSKSGLLGLTRVLAHALGPAGVRVNAIAPGYHRTELTRGMWANPDITGKFAEKSALKRWGEAEDVVGAALFLASPAAAFITGSCLPVDGGYVIGNP